MDTLQTLGSAMGLGLLAGIRLYATVFALGLAVRLGWFHLGPSMSDLHIIANTPVLIASGTACLLEFLADKIPWVDSIWDSVHTFIRPIGATLLGASALGSFDPTVRMLLALLCGSIALTGRSSKAATRLVANHSPEPFTNFGLSVAEDLFVPAGIWVAMEHPILALALVLVFLGVFVWLSPKIFRLLALSWHALRALVQRWSGPPANESTAIPEHAVFSDGIKTLLRSRSAQPLPPELARKLQANYGPGAAAVGLHGAARSGALKNSIGYLCFTPDQLVFVARRTFRARTERVPLGDVQHVEFQPGIFLDRLSVRTEKQEFLFDLFKAAKVQAPHLNRITAYADQR